MSMCKYSGSRAPALQIPSELEASWFSTYFYTFSEGMDGVLGFYNYCLQVYMMNLLNVRCFRRCLVPRSK